MAKDYFEKIKKAISKISAQSKIGRKGIAAVMILLLGIAALVFSEFTENKAALEEKEETTACDESFYEYTQNLENRLTSIISAMSGVGRVKVMVTIASGSENIYLRDSNSGESRDANGKSNIDRKDEYVIVDDGKGESGIIVRVAEPKIRGVAVVCDGAKNEAVASRIIDAVTALLDISSARVSVTPMG